MRVIVIETSGTHTDIALADESSLRHRKVIPSARRHARDLAPGLNELLRELDWTFESINGIAVDIGPGSYTGLRVGVVTAKTLAYALGIPLVGVDVMDALAEQSPPEARYISAIVDAQQENIYVARYRRGATGDIPTLDQETRIMPVRHWLETLDSDDWVTGPALARWRNEFTSKQPLAPSELANPTSEGILKVARRAFLAGRQDDPFQMTPRYLRDSSAQIRWDARHCATPGQG